MTNRRRNQLWSEPNYHTAKWFSEKLLAKEGALYGTLQPCNCIRLSLSAVNRMKIKSLIRNRTKCFSFYENTFLILPVCSALPFYFQYFHYKRLISFGLSKSQKLFLRLFLTFLRKFIPPVIFLTKFENTSQILL